jgi:NADPH-dependent 2,4-dienoyl-CoA reductase/sulfur reductase-like enzyme
LLERAVDEKLIDDIQPDLLVWATGAVQQIPAIKGLRDQYTLTAVEFFEGAKTLKGPRVLVIGAGRAGLEIAEKLGMEGYEVVATKRTDPIGSFMEAITKKLSLKRISDLERVTLMPRTTVKAFETEGVRVVQDEETKILAPFQTVILAAGMLPAEGPAESIRQRVGQVEVIGDAAEVQDIFTAVKAGYDLAGRY